MGVLPILVRRSGRRKIRNVVCQKWKREAYVIVGWQYGGIAISILIVLVTFPVSGHFELDILDVGQGDGIFLRTEEEHTIFVDGGSTSEKQVGTYRVLPFLKYKGVRQIDFWLVSHTDEDHISGLREALKAGYEIERLVFSEYIVRDEAYEELCDLAEENGTQILYVTAGDTLHLGNARIHVLYPKAESNMSFVARGNNAAFTVRQNSALDKNSTSLVFLYEEEGFLALFTGDIGSEQEQEVLDAVESLVAQKVISDVEVDVYKVAHHGSKYSNSEEFLRVLMPEISVISCAERNRYGHPHAETLERLDEVGCKVFRTDRIGQIRITMDKDGNIWGVESVKRE